MKIGFDARMTLSVRKGLGRSTHMLLRHLAKVDRDNEYFIFLDKEDINNEIPDSENFRKIIIPSLNYVTWEQVSLPAKLPLYNPDVFHFPVGTAPINYRGNFILTINDLTRLLPAESLPNYSPRMYEKVSRLYVNWVMKRVSGRAARVIAISEYTKKDIIKYLPVRPENIEVVYLAPSSDFREIDNSKILNDCLLKHKIPNKYIFSLGSGLGFKYTRGLIEAYKYYLTEPSGQGLPLVIAGLAGDSQYAQAVKETRLRRKVFFLGYVDDRDLVALYNAAEFFVFPSLYEGFGLPPLEAMACGTPVVCSNRASLPEVVGEAAYLVNPEDKQQLARSMKLFTENSDLRNEFREKGLQRAEEFSWNSTAGKVIDIYRQVVEGG